MVYSPRGYIIRPVTDDDWPAIVHIQSLAYGNFALETEAVLRSKQTASANYCRVLVIDHQIRGYCLAHAWPAGQVPSLHTALTVGHTSDNLFLHDLALDPAITGQGLAQTLFHAIHRQAMTAGFHSISLAAVQQSRSFWVKQGFIALHTALPLNYGNDATFMTCRLTDNRR